MVGELVCELWTMVRPQASLRSEGTGAQVGDCSRTTQDGYKGGVTKVLLRWRWKNRWNQPDQGTGPSLLTKPTSIDPGTRLAHRTLEVPEDAPLGLPQWQLEWKGVEVD